MTSPKRVSFNPAKYAGRLDDVATLQNLIRGELSHGQIPIIQLFLGRYRIYPCIAIVEALPRSAKLHVPTIRRYLETEQNHNPLDDIVQRQYHVRARSLYITEFLADLGNGIVLDCDHCQLMDDVDNPNQYRNDGPPGYFLIAERIRIHYLPQHENFVVGDLTSKLSSFYVFPSQSKVMQVMTKSPQRTYSFTRVTIKKPIIHDLNVQYGSTFVSFHDRLVKALSNQGWRGIALLHGSEGTGKTYYLRYLINDLEKIPLICIPVDLLNSEPSEILASLKNQQANAILIIDDAESLNRENPTQVLNRLFQLHQYCQQSIIAAFNCSLHSIISHIKTSKLLEHSFEKLSPSNAEALCHLLGVPRSSIPIKQPMSLSEIYGQRTIDPMLQNLIEHEFALAEKENCALS